MRKLLLALGILVAFAGGAAAQAVPQLRNVVTNCGTPNSAYPVGRNMPATQDTTGKDCGSGSGGGSNPAAGATGAAVPADASYNGINVGGTLRGQTGVNPSGSTQAADVNMASIGGTAVAAPANGEGASGSTVQRVTAASATAYGLQTAVSTNSTSVVSGAHTLAAMNLLNITTTVYYLRMYDSAGAPTCSSATGYIRSWPIPPAIAAGLVGGIAVNLGSGGTGFTNGIGFCVTGGPSSTDNTNAATGLFINLDYK